MGRDQRCCLTSHNAQGRLTTKIHQTPKFSCVQLRNPASVNDNFDTGQKEKIIIIRGFYENTAREGLGLGRLLGGKTLGAETGGISLN